MIAACLPTTRRPIRPSPSLSIWSCSPCAAMRSAPWSYGGENRRTRGVGRCPAVSCGPRRTSVPRPRASWSRRRACAPTIRPPHRPFRATARTWNSWRRTGRPTATRACGWSVWRIWPWPPTFPHRGPAGTRTAHAGPRSRSCSARTHSPGGPRPPRRPGTPGARRRKGARRRSPSTMPGSSPTAWSVPAPRSSTPPWPPPSVRRSSRSESFGASTRRSGACPWTRATSTGR